MQYNFALIYANWNFIGVLILQGVGIWPWENEDNKYQIITFLENIIIMIAQIEFPPMLLFEAGDFNTEE